MRMYIELAGVLLACLLGWYIRKDGIEQGKLECQNASTEAAEQARAAADATNAAASDINASTQSYLWGALPPIELRTQEVRERVRNVYITRESTATDDERCHSPARPASVQHDLNEARSRAIAAARGSLRPEPVSESQSRARLHQDRIVAMRQGHGRLRAEPVRADRGRGHEERSLAQMRE